jgi:NADH-quinone oxidoreductase subunit H
MGGNRSLLQYFSYEVPLLVGVAAPAVLHRSWTISRLMESQFGYRWSVFVVPMAFVVALVGLMGKLKRVPFDIPQAKSEVGAGPLTEYSGRKLGLWKLTLAVQTLVGINLMIALFLGGADQAWGHWGFLIYLVKVAVLMAGFSLVQVLYARLRIDQMATIGWRLLVPIGILQMAATVWIGRI